MSRGVRHSDQKRRQYRDAKSGKLGRNEPCFCGSGIKYKKCCLPKGLQPPRPVPGPPPAEVLEHMRQAEARRNELYSKGIYINLPNTMTFKGKTIMAVGNAITWEERENMTFHELILRDLQRTLGKEWWDVETAKKPEERHFIRRCYDNINVQPTGDRQARYEGNGQWSHLPTGIEQTLMSLAFDVYLLAHKGYIPGDWLQRLRHPDEYQGVRYEIAVASLFVRMGCHLEFYDEKATKTKHAEFKAVHAETGNTVVVEAKSRQRPGVINQPGEPDLRKAMLGDVTKLFNKALQKDDEGLPYFIFIDVNAPSSIDVKTIEARWFADVQKMVSVGGEVTAENPQPFNTLFVTNYSPHYDGTEITASGQHVLVTSRFVKYPLKNGVEDVFLGKLQQAANGYGFVPPL